MLTPEILPADLSYSPCFEHCTRCTDRFRRIHYHDFGRYMATEYQLSPVVNSVVELIWDQRSNPTRLYLLPKELLFMLQQYFGVIRIFRFATVTTANVWRREWDDKMYDYVDRHSQVCARYLYCTGCRPGLLQPADRDFARRVCIRFV